MNGLSVQLRAGSRRRKAASAAFVSLALVIGLAACSGDDDDDDADATEEGAADATEEDAATEEAEAPEDTALDAAQAELDAANATIAEQETQISDLTAEVATAEAATAEVQTQLDAETARADTAEADLAALQTQVDAFTANFPVTVSSALQENSDVIGGYNLTLTEVFCAALSTCGQPRPVVRADIIQGPDGLQLQIPNVLTTGLFLTEGALFGVTDSGQIVGPCADGTQTNSQVSTTIFTNDVIVDVDGNQTLGALGASLFVAVNPAGSCGAGNVIFSGTLTPA